MDFCIVDWAFPEVCTDVHKTGDLTVMSKEGTPKTDGWMTGDSVILKHKKTSWFGKVVSFWGSKKEAKEELERMLTEDEELDEDSQGASGEENSRHLESSKTKAKELKEGDSTENPGKNNEEGTKTKKIKKTAKKTSVIEKKVQKSSRKKPQKTYSAVERQPTLQQPSKRRRNSPEGSDNESASEEEQCRGKMQVEFEASQLLTKLHSVAERKRPRKDHSNIPDVEYAEISESDESEREEDIRKTNKVLEESSRNAAVQQVKRSAEEQPISVEDKSPSCSDPRKASNLVQKKLNFSPKGGIEREAEAGGELHVEEDVNDVGSAIISAIRVITEGGNQPIEARIQNCERAIVTLSQHFVKTMQEKSEDKQKDNQCPVSKDEKKKAMEKLHNSPSFGDAVRGLADILFTKEELLSSSVRGRHTNKSRGPRSGLDHQKLSWLIKRVIKKFPDQKERDITTKLADYMKNLTRKETKKS